MQATARMASVVSSMLSARRRLIRSVRPPETNLETNARSTARKRSMLTQIQKHSGQGVFSCQRQTDYLDSEILPPQPHSQADHRRTTNYGSPEHRQPQAEQGVGLKRQSR